MHDGNVAVADEHEIGIRIMIQIRQRHHCRTDRRRLQSAQLKLAHAAIDECGEILRRAGKNVGMTVAIDIANRQRLRRECRQRCSDRKRTVAVAKERSDELTIGDDEIGIPIAIEIRRCDRGRRVGEQKCGSDRIRSAVRVCEHDRQ